LAAHYLDAFPWNGAYRQLGATLQALGILACAAVALPWVSAPRRVWLSLAASVAMGALVAGWLIVVPVAFALLAVEVARRAGGVAWKLLVLLGVWLLLIVLRWAAPAWLRLQFGAWGLYWTCIPPAVIYLVVERSRGQLRDVSRAHEWEYLLALPRFLLPFLQPIGARAFISSRKTSQTPRLALRAFGLSLYAAAGLWVLKATHFAVKSPSDDFSLVLHGPQILANCVLVYAVNASYIFCAVAMFRVLGHDLGSGFRFPFLADSVGDFYRRWNYYFYEYVSSIFYVPLVSWLRRRFPLGLAYILAGYPSILLGVWAVDNVTFQLAVSRGPGSAIEQMTNGRELAGYAAIWTLIIVPHLLASGFRRLRQRRWWQFSARLLTLLAGVVVAVVTFWVGVAIY